MVNSTDIWVVIPTYWGTVDTAVYDHPTPLDGESTLPRLLGSLLAQEDAPPFHILLLVAATDTAVEAIAVRRVKSLLRPYQNKLNLMLADDGAAQLINDHLQMEWAAMHGYGAVRNMQLLIPAILGATIIVAVDDDEVLPPDYIAQAVRWMERPYQGETVLGLAGPYLDADNNFTSPDPSPSANIFAGKMTFMNETLRLLMRAGDSLCKTPLALGGNMMFHRDLFTQVGFDPAITRGEDIDYLINARLAGHNFYFAPQLTITHLPPRHYEASEYGKLRQDVFRFVYEREKVRLGHLAVADFYPYPGRFLQDDLLMEARRALETAVDTHSSAQFGTPDAIIAAAQEYALEQAPVYFKFAQQWPQLVAKLVNDSILPAEMRINVALHDFLKIHPYE